VTGSVGAAGALTCPQCGAPVAPDARTCPYCSTVLALVACPSCFAQVFEGASHCSHCGAAVKRAEATAAEGACPRCHTRLAAARVGSVTLGECGDCGGVWLDAESFERICREREQQAAVLAAPQRPPAKPVPPPEGYLPCPTCHRLMNRLNFAHVSGVVVDVCRGHGTWFDAHELRRIVEFLRDGGLERVRAREREDLADERRMLRDQERELAMGHRFTGLGLKAPGPRLELEDILSVAKGILKSL
jgi:Zn-finger nucleic acid-binding protein